MRKTRPLLALLALLAGCSNTLEVRIHNATSSSLTVAIRVDRVGPRNESLDQATLKPDERVTLGPISAPPLEYIELAITRPGDLANVPTSRRIPRSDSSWTIAPDPESWTGYSLVEGIDEPAPPHD